MTTKLLMVLALSLAACGAKTSAPPAPVTPGAEASSCEPPPPAPSPLELGSCSK